MATVTSIEAAKPRHDYEVKVRVTESTHDFLQAEAARLDVPPAVLARNYINAQAQIARARREKEGPDSPSNRVFFRKRRAG